MNKSTIIGYISALLAAVLFGSVPTIAKPVISDINVLLLSSIAYLIAALTFTPIARKTKTALAKKDYIILVAISICGAAAAPYLYFLGLHQSSATDTSLLSNVEIMFTVLFGLLFFKERLRPLGFISVALVLSGVVIITTNLQFSGSLSHLNAGHFFILGSMVLWALDNNLSRIIATRIDTARLVQLKSAIGGLILLATVFLLGIPFDIKASQIPQVILLSAIGFGGSLYFFLQSLKRIGTIRTIMIFSMASVFGLVFASVFLHEQISVYQAGAIAIMLTGIYMINRKESMKEKLET
ncbi:MAG TPA: DMT family transporter [Nitrososphaeraceae archaeon]|nr:DMT family transporter [Nitrososphaeraceae archaeon]